MTGTDVVDSIATELAVDDEVVPSVVVEEVPLQATRRTNSSQTQRFMTL
ncbi:MAG: hypothetical protein ACN4GK_06605 [Acidimicrobiia bacterium]